MAAVIGMCNFTLKPGVTPAEVEQVIQTELRAVQTPAGIRARFFRCDRGPFDGRYAMVPEIESVAVRDRYWPQSGVESALQDAYLREHGEVWNRLFALVETDVNDYVEFSDGGKP
jgi:hypothetical protein